MTNLDRRRKKNLQEEAAVPLREKKSIDSDLEEERVGSFGKGLKLLVKLGG